MALKKPNPSCKVSNTPVAVICSPFSASFFNIANNISCFLRVLGFSIPSFSASDIKSAGDLSLSSCKFMLENLIDVKYLYI